MWRDTNTISELEFLAENNVIEIIPLFRKEEINLICVLYIFIQGKYGPFRPNKSVKVPLWLALQYKKNKQCTIIAPHWLDTEILTEKLNLEKKYDSLQELVYYFYEISQILLHKYNFLIK